MGKYYMPLIDQMQKHCQESLAAKHREYASEESDYHNFVVAAELQNCTPERALIGMMDKHVVSVHDLVTMLDAGQKLPADYWKEKIGDNINYLLILWAMVNELGDCDGKAED